MSMIQSNHGEYLGSISTVQAQGAEIVERLTEVISQIDNLTQSSNGNTTNEWSDIRGLLKHSTDETEEVVQQYVAAHSGNQDSIMTDDLVGLGG